MAKGNNYGNLQRPSGRNHLEMFTSSESALAKFLYPITWRDTVFVIDDFTGPALSTHLWTAAKIASNGTDFDPPATQLVNGVCQGVTGAFAQDHANLRSDAVWYGDLNCGAEVCFKVSNKLSLGLEMGFVDPLSSYTQSDAGAVSGIDTPGVTNGATDAALVTMYTTETANTLNLITDGSTSNMNATATSFAVTPTNATYLTVRVQLAKTASAVAAAKGTILNENDAISAYAQHGAALASQIKGDVLQHFWFYVESLTTSARTVDIDYVALWQDRR